MPRKSVKNDDDSGSDTPFGGNQQGANAPDRSSWIKYAIILAIVAVAVAIIYFAVTGFGSQGLTSSQVFSNVSGANLNRTQALFVSDLEKSQNVSRLVVAYTAVNITAANTTSNTTIVSYVLGSYNKTVITSVNATDVNTTTYYATNTTLTCFNVTALPGAPQVNSGLSCDSGDRGLSYMEESPFTAANVSSLSYLVFNATVEFEGPKSIAGRSCDDFVISNETASNEQSDYIVFNLCIDSQYGVPLYFNETEVYQGVPYAAAATATSVSTDVTGSDFTIPQQYLNAVPRAIV